MAWTDDPAMDEIRHMEQKEEMLDRHPRCDICGARIQDDHFYIIDGDQYCKECMEENFMVKTENNIE